jgi:predicted S18 family serine protease
MKKVNNILCARADDLIAIAKPDNESKYEYGLNLTILGKNATENEAYYSSASYCFRASIYLRWLALIQKDPSSRNFNQEIKDLQKEITKTDMKTNSYETVTLTDMQTKIIVHDRLVEAEDYLKDAKEIIDNNNYYNNTDTALYYLAYAIERHYSATVWSSFFGTGKKEIILDNESLKLSCTEKLSEAEERYQYVLLYIPSALKNTRQELDSAYSDLKKRNYEYCLYKAARAKAESDLLLSILGLNDDTTDEFLDIKLALIENIIAKNQKNENFPILGFSYYEYAKSLRQQDKYSAQLFAEYALELSNLDMYFKKESIKSSFVKLNYQNTNLKEMLFLILGIIIGVSITFLSLHKTRKKYHNSIYIKIK